MYYPQIFQRIRNTRLGVSKRSYTKITTTTQPATKSPSLMIMIEMRAFLASKGSGAALANIGTWTRWLRIS
jgi:hypothetical protein